MSSNNNYALFTRQVAKQLGFDYCGIAKAGFLNEDAKRLEGWLQKGYNGSMQYMQNHFELRVNPQQLVPGAKTVITLLKNYFPSERQNNAAPKISKYAYGQDYHLIIKQQLFNLLAELKKQIGTFNGRGFVDSAPVLERAWAVKSGLGWIGKNGNLINKNSGSFFFIASLVIDVEMLYDEPFAKDYCGSCTRCVDACPTEAILPDKVIDGSKCISYFTIELKDALLPANMQDKFNNWMFGCDVCQDVCPWNRFAKAHDEPGFKPAAEILNFSSNQWDELTEESFKIIFKDSPLKRAKFSGIKRNLRFLQNHQ